MRTLILRLSSLGDVLLATAVLRPLRDADPGGTIDVCTRPVYTELFAGDPRVHEVIAYDDQSPATTIALLRAKEKYDCVIDLHNNVRTRSIRHALGARTFVVRKPTFKKWLLVHAKINLLGDGGKIYQTNQSDQTDSSDDLFQLRAAPPRDIVHMYLRTLAPLGIVDTGGGAAFTPGPAALPSALDAFLTNNTVVGVCPGAKHFTKRWPAERYAALCNQLLNGGNNRVVLFGSDDDAAICAQIETLCSAQSNVFNACGRLTLSQIALAMDRCNAVVTNDSGLMHLAAARNRPVVAIFGSTVREFGFVPRHNATVVENIALRCRPCSHIGRDTCPKGHFKCMLEIDAAQVMRALTPLLANS